MMISAREYHEETSYSRYEMQGHGLDWGSQPSVFKEYPGLKSLELPKVTDWSEKNLSELIRESDPEAPNTEIHINCLSRVLMLTHSITARARHAGAYFYYRSVASAGALYPFELYVATRDVAGLNDGLYHHRVADQALVQLRPGDIGYEIADVIQPPLDSLPMMTFFLTSIFFRSSWKYRDRGYRYNLLDTGHLCENLYLALKAEGLSHTFCHDFDDERVNRMLGVDERREVCLSIACLRGGSPGPRETTTDSEAPPETLAAASKVSRMEIDYSAIKDMHSLSSRLVSGGDAFPRILDIMETSLVSEKPFQGCETWPEKMSYAESIFRRRSMRNFVTEQLPADYLDALLESVFSSLGATTTESELFEGESISVGLLARNVEGLTSGMYILDGEKRSIRTIMEAEMTDKMARVCLGQAWLANCALHFLFMSNLETIELNRGPRGYRHALLKAGRIGQRIYLTATSMKIGCCGIGAFFDDEASQILQLNYQSKLLYLVAAGPVRKWSIE